MVVTKIMMPGAGGDNQSIVINFAVSEHDLPFVDIDIYRLA